MRTLALFVSLVICSVANAELTLKINGPSEGKTGDLIVLDCIGSEANLKSWIIPDDLEGKSLLGCKDQVAFATRDPGVYTFFLYGTDGETLLHTKHVVTIEGSKPVDPEDPPPIDPPPVGNFDELTKSSKELSLKLNDSTTRQMLAESLKKSSYGDDLDSAQANFERLFTTTLARRSRDQQDANWFEGWYVPMLKQLQALSKLGAVKNVAQYNQAMNAVVMGLK